MIEVMIPPSRHIRFERRPVPRVVDLPLLDPVVHDVGDRDVSRQRIVAPNTNGAVLRRSGRARFEIDFNAPPCIGRTKRSGR